MRIQRALGILFVFFAVSSCLATTRHYYIAAEEGTWDYAPSGHNLLNGNVIPQPWELKRQWLKTRFIEYTDGTFTTRKPQPIWLGILGPVIRAEVGDEVVVEFLNRSRRGHDIHPHGLRYDKINEGSLYLPVAKGGFVGPGSRYTYHWFANETSGPGAGQPSSIVWWYHAHVDAGVEINAGLLGPIVVTAKGKANPDGSPKDVDREFIASFMVFDEMGGKREGLFYAINGFIFGNLPGLMMKQGEKVRWYLLGMGNEIDLHTPHWHGETVTGCRQKHGCDRTSSRKHEDRGHGRRQSWHLDVSLPCGRSHGSRHDGGLHHCRGAHSFLPNFICWRRFLEKSGEVHGDCEKHRRQNDY